MNISFVIITDSKKFNEICLQIKSIKKQNISKYEIIISGYISDKLKHFLNICDVPFTVLDLKEAANSGGLGQMRNAACKICKYDNIVISDDDMLFTNQWYISLIKNQDFDILTTRVMLPDGTRFWDHCCYMSPANGHKILNPEENDNFLYMSGGQSWIMKKYVFDTFQWDENLHIYNMSNINDYNNGKHNEDTEYSLRCRSKFKISHNHDIIVYHNDASYTSYGRVVRRRYNKSDHKWCEKIKLPHQVIVDIASSLIKIGLEAESVDLFRKLYIETKEQSIKNILDDIDKQLGGPLQDSHFTFNNEEYYNLIEIENHHE